MPRLTNSQLFTNSSQLIKSAQIITTHGWIKSIRSQSTMFFISMSDGSDARPVQVTGPTNEFADLLGDQINTGTAIQVTGTLTPHPSNPNAWEITPQTIKSYGPIQDLSTYPIAKSKLGIDFLRGLPHLRSRTNFFSAVNRIRHRMMKATHDFYDGEGFAHLDPNILTVNECEGGAGVFTVTELLGSKVSEIPSLPDGSIDWSKDHFKRKVFLTVSSQLHLEGLAMSMGRVYTTNKSFRAEHSLTSKHVSEFAHLEIEQCFTTFEDLMDIAERYVRYVMTQVYTLNRADLDLLIQTGKFNSEFVEKDFIDRYAQVLTPSPWVKIKYADAIELIKANSDKLPAGEQAPEYGQDMSSACERLLTDHFAGPVFLTHWPQSIKSFYMAQLDDGTCESFDLLIPGVGELIGASQRETDYSKLLAQMEAKGINPTGLEFYTDLRKYGTAPHGGFGLGLDRFLMYMTGMKNIKDVIPYPVYYTSCNF
jgi:asparaginyl-tRNA synthetase